MKKSVVIGILVLATIVLVSPAIVGRFAERSMDANLNWAAAESGAVSVQAEHYDRGWFSSEGQHRIELREGNLLSALQLLAGPMSADDLPILIINTRLDHGLIPLSSMSRERGSLAPGLGSAISTLQLETPAGERIDLPGTIFSKVTLGGELASKYVIEAGTHHVDEVDSGWSEARINVTTDPRNAEVVYDGHVDTVFMNTDDESIALEKLRFDGKRRPTKFGVSVGNVDMNFDSLSVHNTMRPAYRVGPVSISASSQLDGEGIDADAEMHMGFNGLPQFENMHVDMSFHLDDVDAAALGNIQRASKEAQNSADPMAVYASVQDDLKRLFAAGFEFRVDTLDVTVPDGKIVSKMRFSFAEKDPATFEWVSLLLGTEASIDLSIPATIVETFGQGNPQIAAAIGGGYLVKKGDAYQMSALLKKGLLTVNGAPIPIPLGLN